MHGRFKDFISSVLPWGMERSHAFMNKHFPEHHQCTVNPGTCLLPGAMFNPMIFTKSLFYNNDLVACDLIFNIYLTKLKNHFRQIIEHHITERIINLNFFLQISIILMQCQWFQDRMLAIRGKMGKEYLNQKCISFYYTRKKNMTLCSGIQSESLKRTPSQE